MAVKVRYTGEASGLEGMALPGRPPVYVGDVLELPKEKADRYVASGNFEHVKAPKEPEPAAPDPAPAVPAKTKHASSDAPAKEAPAADAGETKGDA